MAMKFTFNGTDSVEVVIKGLQDSAVATIGDILYALNRQKTRIVQRTLRGRDVNNDLFAPYSEKGPFYWYPQGPKSSTKSRQAAAAKKSKQLGAQKTTLGLKFKSYGDFKRSLGRTVVDLFGPTAPHMLQAIVVKVGGRVTYDKVTNLLLVSGKIADNPRPANEGTIGIYGPEAERATTHNNGDGKLPRREFFGVNDSDATEIANDIHRRIAGRMRRFVQ